MISSKDEKAGDFNNLKPSPKGIIIKLFVGAVFLLAAPMFIAGANGLDLVNQCKYHYTYDNLGPDVSGYSFLGLHLTLYDKGADKHGATVPWCLQFDKEKGADGDYSACFESDRDRTNSCDKYKTWHKDRANATHQEKHDHAKAQYDKECPNGILTPCWGFSYPDFRYTDGSSHINAADRIIAPIFRGLETFALVMVVVIIVGPGIMLLRYQIRSKQ